MVRTAAVPVDRDHPDGKKTYTAEQEAARDLEDAQFSDPTRLRSEAVRTAKAGRSGSMSDADFKYVFAQVLQQLLDSAVIIETPAINKYLSRFSRIRGENPMPEGVTDDDAVDV